MKTIEKHLTVVLDKNDIEQALLAYIRVRYSNHAIETSGMSQFHKDIELYFTVTPHMSTPQ